MLIMGTIIGVGMFGLPITQGAGGFIPAMLVLALCWIYTVCCARLLLEACTWMPRGANFMTIARNLVGKKGAFFCWLFYSIFFYCGMTAHISAAGNTISALFSHMFSHSLASIFYTAIFCAFVYSSMKASDFLNRVIVGALSFTFLLFILSTFHEIQPDLLVEQRWMNAWPAVPVVLFAFAFQFIIPPLYNYLDGDTFAMKKAIWIGSTSIFILYTLWNLMILGIVPGQELFKTLMAGGSSIHALEEILQNRLISGIAQEFAILAISTSFLGVSISFFDFWADSLHWEKKGSQGVILIGIVFALPLMFALSYPDVFIEALNLGGEVGASLLLGIFPVLFVWVGRYYKYREITPQLLPGGKVGLTLIVLASLAVLLIKHIIPFTGV